MINEFIKNLQKNNIPYDDEKLTQLNIYYNFLIDYNSHTNVTAITDENLSNQNILDIGSGAGFPGIVLKIFYPDIKLTVLDSNNKKITFINMLLEKLNIKDIVTVCDRAENYMKDHLNEFDIVLSRAVAYADIITSLSVPFIKKDGVIILMKGNYEGEIKVLNTYKNELNISSIDIINYDILSNENNRSLIVIKKNNESSKVVNYAKLLKQSENRKKKLNLK